MKISAIELYRVALPFSGTGGSSDDTYKLSGGRTYTEFDASIVRIVSDNGHQGWCESTPFGSTYIAAHPAGTRAGIELLAPALLGADPRAFERINSVMDETLVGHNDARTALDVACWDLTARSFNVPVHLLLGGSTRQRMPVISSIYSGSPDEMRARVAQYRAKGFKGHSLKIGATEAEGGPQLDAERIQACLADREAGEFYLADANGGLTVESALRLQSLLPDSCDFVLEAPCASWQETLMLRERCRIPIMLDELIQQDADIVHAISTRAADAIGLKISKAGGLTPARRQRDICKAAGLTMSVQDTVGSTIAFAAILQLAQTVPPHLLRCVLDVRGMVSLATAELYAPVVDGGVMAPDAPGLGLDVDREKLGEPVATWSL